MSKQIHANKLRVNKYHVTVQLPRDYSKLNQIVPSQGRTSLPK